MDELLLLLWVFGLLALTVIAMIIGVATVGLALAAWADRRIERERAKHAHHTGSDRG